MLLGVRPFSKRWVEDSDNTDLLDKQLVEAEKNYFKNNLSQKQQNYLKAERLAMLSMQAKFMQDDKHWWNRLQRMSPEDFKALPYGFIKKYGSIADQLAMQRAEYQHESNKKYNGYWDQVKRLQTLQTNEEKAQD
jgi:hypothetical protein